MRKGIKYCPAENKKVVQAVRCKGYSCENCPELKQNTQLRPTDFADKCLDIIIEKINMETLLNIFSMTHGKDIVEKTLREIDLIQTNQKILTSDTSESAMWLWQSVMEKQRFAFQEYISGIYHKAFENMPSTREVMKPLQLNKMNNCHISLQIISSLRLFHPILDLFETAKQKGLLLKQEYPKKEKERKLANESIDNLLSISFIRNKLINDLLDMKERLSLKESVKKCKYNQILESQYLFLLQELIGVSSTFKQIQTDGQSEYQEVIQLYIGGIQQSKLSDSELQEKIDKFYSIPLNWGTKLENFYFKALQCLIYKLLLQADKKKMQARKRAANIIKTALKELLPAFPSYHSLDSHVSFLS